MSRPVKLRMGAMEMDGAAPGDRAALEAAVRRELQRLIAHRGVPGGSSSGASAANAGPVRVTPGASVNAMAAQIARSAYARMGGGK